jgi:hypothetical protein
MSPPIFTPDGSKVREIVLPDGSTATEVVAPDGSIVFTPPIPDSGIIDSFEDEDLTEYSGETSDFSTTTGTADSSFTSATDGSYFLRTDTDFNATIVSADGDGLERYPKRGNTIKYDTNLDGDDVAEFRFGLVDTSNFYRAVVDAFADEIRLEKDESGTNTTLGSASIDIPLIDWLQVTVEFDINGNGDISFILDNAGSRLNSVTVNNTALDGGGIGFSGESGGKGFFVRWDHVRIP